MRKINSWIVCGVCGKQEECEAEGLPAGWYAVSYARARQGVFPGLTRQMAYGTVEACSEECALSWFEKEVKNEVGR